MNNHKINCQMSSKGWAASVPPVCTCSPLTLPSPTQVCPECKKTHESDFDRYCKENPIDPIIKYHGDNMVCLGCGLKKNICKESCSWYKQDMRDWKEKILERIFESHFNEDRSFYYMSMTMDKKELLDTISSAIAQARTEEHQFFLNILDGIDIADKQMQNKGGGTRAIRAALASRIINE